MKVAIILLAVAVVGAFAQEASTDACEGNSFLCKVKELGQLIKSHADKLKETGVSMLSKALDYGKNILLAGAAGVAGTVRDYLDKAGLIGKRDLAFFSKIKEQLSKGVENMGKIKEGLKNAFKKVVDQITGFVQNSKMVEDTASEVDGAVESYKNKAVAFAKQMKDTISKHLMSIFSKSMEHVESKRAVLGQISDLWNLAKSTFANVVKGASDTFAPHLDAIGKTVDTLAAKAKEHVKNLANGGNLDFDDIKAKLAGHLSTLKGHAAKIGDSATKALEKLQKSASDIVSKAVSAVKDAVKDA